MVLALFHGANVAKTETGLADGEVLLTGTGPEQKAMINYLGEYKTLDNVLKRMDELYEKESGDVIVYIGTIDAVQEAMASGTPPAPLEKGVMSFAVGVKSLIDWKWDLDLFSVPSVNEKAFSLVPKRDPKWIFSEDSCTVGVRIPIIYRDQNANALFWKHKTDGLPQSLKDEDMMEMFNSFIRIESTGSKSYGGVAFPILKGGVLARHSSANDKSKLVGKSFGSSGFQIIKAIQAASFDLNEEGGIAKSKTEIWATRGGGPKKSLSFVDVPFGLAIEILDETHNMAHTMYVGYYNPPEKK